MENEMITVLHPDEEVNSACVCADGEELSVCNTENDETVTIYEADDCDCLPDFNEESAVESKKEKLMRKCREAKEACQSTASRLVSDWKETEGNPYIKQTRITRVEIYRNCNEEQPIDSFETTDVKSYSARAFLVASAATALLVAASGKLVKKFLK